MSKSNKKQISEFAIEGRLLEFIFKDGYKLKGLLLATSEGERYVKLAKHFRTTSDLRLQPGSWLHVEGEKKHNLKKGEVKLTAYRITSDDLPPQPTALDRPETPTETKSQKKKAQATILVCQKSDCRKRGSDAVCKALEAALSDTTLSSMSEQVSIKGTGCMKKCKAGPNLVMPDKTRYSRVKPEQVPQIVEKHLTDPQADRYEESKEVVLAALSENNNSGQNGSSNQNC